MQLSLLLQLQLTIMLKLHFFNDAVFAAISVAEVAVVNVVAVGFINEATVFSYLTTLWRA